MIGQESLFTLMLPNQIPLGYEGEWLRANGWKNVYDERPRPGKYWVIDINHFEIQKVLERTNTGWIVTWNTDWRPVWYKPYPKKAVDIKGLCDDAYCPECGYEFLYPEETDSEICPTCKTFLDWAPWHRMNDEEDKDERDRTDEGGK